MVEVCIAALDIEKFCLSSRSFSISLPSLPAPWMLTMREGEDDSSGRRLWMKRMRT